MRQFFFRFKFERFRLRIISLLLIFFGLALSYQNCGDVGIIAQQNSNFSSQALIKLPAPSSKDLRHRIVILLDQSHSMKFGPCPDDLDQPEASPKPNSSCNPGPGADSLGQRFSMIESWIQEWNFISPTSGSELFRVAIIPFSGGKHQRPLATDENKNFGFLSTEEAKTWIEKLRSEHVNEPAFGDSKKMGTSSLAQPLKWTNSLIAEELRLLPSTNDSLQFHFVIVSDGESRGTISLLQKLQSLMGCSVASQTTLCKEILPQKFAAAFGDPAANESSSLVNQLNQIADLVKSATLRDLKSYRVQLASREGYQDKDSQFFNFLSSLENQGGLGGLERMNKDGESLPLIKAPQLSTHMSSFYQVSDFYAVNLQAYVNSEGRLVADSDADGLSDEEELKFGYDPVDPRSKSACLDGIHVKFGCPSEVRCSRSADFDQDGLNSCEEIAISANDASSDSDKDGILDFFEALRFPLSANRDDKRIQSSTSGQTHYSLFISGVHVRAGQQVPSDAKIQFKLAQVGTDLQQKTPQYEFALKVPTVSVRASTASSLGSESLKFWSINGRSDVNTIGVFLKVQNISDPTDFYWVHARIDILVKNSNLLISAPESFPFRVLEGLRN